MILVFRFAKLLTILIFIGVLGFTYYDMAERTGTGLIYLFFYKQSDLYESIDTGTYFMFPAVFLFALNLLVSLTKALYRRVPKQYISIPNKAFWLSDDEKIHQLNTIVEVWMDTFVTAVQILGITLMLQVWQVNRDMAGAADKYIIYVVFGILIIVIWTGFILFRFFFKK